MIIKVSRHLLLMLFLILSLQGCKARLIVNQPTEDEISQMRSTAQSYIDSRYNAIMPRFYLDRLAPSVTIRWQLAETQPEGGKTDVMMQPVVTPRIFSPISFGLTMMYFLIAIVFVIGADIRLKLIGGDNYHVDISEQDRLISIFILAFVIIYFLLSLYFYQFHVTNINFDLPDGSRNETSLKIGRFFLSILIGWITTGMIFATGYSVLFLVALALVSLPILIFFAVIRLVWIPWNWQPLQQVDADQHVLFGFAVFGAVVLSGLTFSATVLGAAGFAGFRRLREKVRSARYARQLQRIHRQSEAEAEAASVTDVVERLRLLDTHLNSLKFATRSTDRMMIIGHALEVIDHLTRSAEMSGANPEAVQRLEDWLPELEKPELSDPVLKKRFMSMYEKFIQS